MLLADIRTSSNPITEIQCFSYFFRGNYWRLVNRTLCVVLLSTEVRVNSEPLQKHAWAQVILLAWLAAAAADTSHLHVAFSVDSSGQIQSAHHHRKWIRLSFDFVCLHSPQSERVTIGVETVSVKLSKPDSRFGLWPYEKENTNRGMSGLCHGSIGRLVQIILFVVLFFQLSLFQLSVSFLVVVHIHRGVRK